MRLSWLVVMLALVAAACGGSSSVATEDGAGSDADADAQSGVEEEPTVFPTPTPTPAVAPGPDTPVESTYAQPLARVDGNRVVEGAGAMAVGEQLDIELPGRPEWVVGLPSPSGDVWAVALNDGTVLGYRIAGGLVTQVPIGADRLPAGQPPVLVERDGRVELAPSPVNASPNSAPRFMGDRIVYIDNLGELTILDPDGTTHKPDVDVLPDAQLIEDGTGRVLVLAGPTERYPHGVLGDNLEATQVVAVDPETAEIDLVYEVGEAVVIESVAPLLGDLTGDGSLDILLTVSNNEVGARLRLVDTDGNVIAQSDGLGRGERWRHQVAIAGVGPGGEMEVVAVRTPHISGVLEYLRLEGDVLQPVAELDGFQSHAIGSRNFDQVLVADGDGDGALEVIAPTADRTLLQGTERTPDGTVGVWGRALDGRLTTNIGSISREDGTLSIAVGTQEGNKLRVWP